MSQRCYIYIGRLCECRPFGEIPPPTPFPTPVPTTPFPTPAPTTRAPIVPTFAPSSPAPGAPGPKTIAPSGYGKTPVPAPALPTSDTKGKKDGKKKMSKIRKP